jgi:hypothetical protein
MAESHKSLAQRQRFEKEYALLSSPEKGEIIYFHEYYSTIELITPR